MQFSSSDMQNHHSERQALIDRLPWSSETFLPTEAVPIEEQILGLQKVIDLQENLLKSLYAPRLKRLRETYQGYQRCFIIANGASLAHTDLAQLQNEVTFCADDFIFKARELNWQPTFYLVEDRLVAEERAEAISALTGSIKLIPSYLAYCLEKDPDTIFFDHRARDNASQTVQFSDNAANVVYAENVAAFTAIQLAHYFGFREIYLLGSDADIPVDADFDEDASARLPDLTVEAYTAARNVADSTSRPIYDATVGDTLDIFKRRAFVDVFPEARSESELLTSDAQSHLTISPRLSRFPKVAVLGALPASISSKANTGLLKGWPRERVLQIETAGPRTISFSGGPVTVAEVSPQYENEAMSLELLKAFDADVVLYRPRANALKLHNLFERARDELVTPYVVWVGDDTAPQPTEDWQDRVKRLVDQAAHRMTSKPLPEEFLATVDKTPEDFELVDVSKNVDWVLAALRSSASKRSRSEYVADPKYVSSLIQKGQPVRTIIEAEPMEMTRQKSRPKRMSDFYRGWRGIVAGASVGAMSWPAVAAAVKGQVSEALVWSGPAVAVAVIFLFFGYLFTLIEDQNG